MFENAIANVQRLEQSVAGKSLSDLQIRLALRSCLKELRMLTVARADIAPPLVPDDTEARSDGLIPRD
jgi:hypothetical protein